MNIPDDAVVVPSHKDPSVTYTIWRDDLTVHAILASGEHVQETFSNEQDATLIFLHYAYMH